MSLPAPVARALRHPVWLALAAGVAAVAGFAPVGWYPLAVLCPALLFLLWEDAAPRRAAGLGFAWGGGLFLAGTWWIFTAVHVFGKAPAWLAAFLTLALVAIMATYYGLLGWAAARFRTPQRPLHWLVVVPAGWTLMEWLRGWLFSGFPWLQLGYAHVDSPLSGWAPLGGIHLVTLAGAVTAGAVVVALRGAARERLAAAAVAATLWGGGAALVGHAWTAPAGGAIDVAVVQSAVPQEDKWQDDNREAIFEQYLSMTRPVLGTPLIVWPEAALPALAHEAAPWLSGVWAEARAAGSDLVLGLLRYDAETGRYHNGVLALSDDAEWYDKRRLVPFGEFFPVPPAVRRWMRLMSLTYVDMSPGAERQPPLRAAGVLIGATVCYEDAYGADQLPVLGSATLLVNVTNNAWYGDSGAPHQQMQMARFRALEAGRYLVRATSNGITGIVAPDGRIAARARQFVPEVLRGTVWPYQGLTPYARNGNWPVLLYCLVALLPALAVLRPRRTGRGRPDRT